MRLFLSSSLLKSLLERSEINNFFRRDLDTSDGGGGTAFISSADAGSLKEESAPWMDGRLTPSGGENPSHHFAMGIHLKCNTFSRPNTLSCLRQMHLVRSEGSKVCI